METTGMPEEQNHRGQLPGRMPGWKHSWSHRTSKIAAIFIAALLVGSLLLTLTLLHRQNSSASAGLCAPPASSATGGTYFTPTDIPIWESIQMFGAQTGWAKVQRQTTPKPVLRDQMPTFLVRTCDGGKHWEDVTPPQVKIWGTIQFLSGSVAWIVGAPFPDGDAMLLHTADGGQHWQSMPAGYRLPHDQYFTPISALSAQECWLLVDGALRHTVDGGKTWVTLPKPAQFTMSGMRFLNSLVGWAEAASTNIDNSTNYYRTRDGGHTWQQQRLALPPHLPAGSLSIGLPTFFNAREGIIPANYQKLPQFFYAIFFVTHDEGITWQASPPVTDMNTAAAMLDYAYFFDSNHWLGMVTLGDPGSSGGISSIIHETYDGGQHWASFTANYVRHAYFDIVHSFTFVSDKVGWAIGDFNLISQDNAPTANYLLKTTDGGHNWKVIN